MSSPNKKRKKKEKNSLEGDKCQKPQLNEMTKDNLIISQPDQTSLLSQHKMKYTQVILCIHFIRDDLKSSQEESDIITRYPTIEVIADEISFKVICE